jgi:hypothetical protein
VKYSCFNGAGAALGIVDRYLRRRFARLKLRAHFLQARGKRLNLLSNGPLAQELPNDFLRVHWSVESQGYWLRAISAAAL